MIKARHLLILIFVSVLFSFYSCRSQEALLDEVSPGHKVYLSAEDVRITSETSFFSEQAILKLQDDKTIDRTGEELLQKVMQGYQSFTRNYEFTDRREEAEWVFQVDEIYVDKGFFTLNIPHPGPILKMNMIVSIYDEAEIEHTDLYSVRVNMSRVNFSDETVHWMSKEEKRDPKYQITAFEEGLRELYEKLYFESFGIKL